MVSLDKCNGIGNTLNDFSSGICVLNKTGLVNFSVFNMITRINESETLKKDIFHVPGNVNLMVENVV